MSHEGETIYEYIPRAESFEIAPDGTCVRLYLKDNGGTFQFSTEGNPPDVVRNVFSAYPHITEKAAVQFGTATAVAPAAPTTTAPVNQVPTPVQQNSTDPKPLEAKDFISPNFGNSEFRKSVSAAVARMSEDPESQPDALPGVEIIVGRECTDKKFGDLYYSFFIWARSQEKVGSKSFARLFPGDENNPESFLSGQEGLWDTWPLRRPRYIYDTIFGDNDDTIAEKFTLIFENPATRRSGIATSEFRNMMEKYIMECIEGADPRKAGSLTGPDRKISKGGRDFINNYLQALSANSPGDSIKGIATAFGEFVEKQQYRKVKDWRTLPAVQAVKVPFTFSTKGVKVAFGLTTTLPFRPKTGEVFKNFFKRSVNFAISVPILVTLGGAVLAAAGPYIAVVAAISGGAIYGVRKIDNNNKDNPKLRVTDINGNKLKIRAREITHVQHGAESTIKNPILEYVQTKDGSIYKVTEPKAQIEAGKRLTGPENLKDNTSAPLAHSYKPYKRDGSIANASDLTLANSFTNPPKTQNTNQQQPQQTVTPPKPSIWKMTKVKAATLFGIATIGAIGSIPVISESVSKPKDVPGKKPVPENVVTPTKAEPELTPRQKFDTRIDEALKSDAPKAEKLKEVMRARGEWLRNGGAPEAVQPQYEKAKEAVEKMSDKSAKVETAIKDTAPEKVALFGGGLGMNGRGLVRIPGGIA